MRGALSTTGNQRAEKGAGDAPETSSSAVLPELAAPTSGGESDPWYTRIQAGNFHHRYDDRTSRENYFIALFFSGLTRVPLVRLTGKSGYIPTNEIH